MACVTTMAPILQPLMDCPSVETDWCAWCGRTYPLNRHHMVFRSQGELYRDGKKVPKPTIVLCGSGTQGCHGLAHRRRLHFKYDGELWGLETAEPTKYQTALEMDGWRRIAPQSA